MKPYSSASGGGAIYLNNEAYLDMAVVGLSHAKAIPLKLERVKDSER